MSVIKNLHKWRLQRRRAAVRHYEQKLASAKTQRSKNMLLNRLNYAKRQLAELEAEK